MKDTYLLLTNARGEELGRLPVPTVQVAPPGQADVSTPLSNQMSEVYTAIEAALHAEGMEVALDPLDFQIAVSMALLKDSGEDDVLIPLPVREIRSSESTRDQPESNEGETDTWDTLFTLDETEEETNP